jgi:transcriptional regulator with GAF, ATPase, and Fis domain
LVAIVRNAVELGRALRRAQLLERENSALRSAAADLPVLVAESAVMRPVLQLMERVGPSDANVLITGEHGTGKELVATWLHASSARARRGFVAVNMGGLSDGVFESELFGHVKGAFTDARADRVGRFELADGGTIFLDEIANITLSQQSKLLRVLQGGELERVGSSKVRQVDVRVLSATNSVLQSEVQAGRFREDLLFRLNTIQLQLPPLRERREDIARWPALFLQRHAARYRKCSRGRARATQAAGAWVARQHPGAGACGRACGADGAGSRGAGDRPGAPARRRRSTALRGPAAGRGGADPHPQGDGPARRQRVACRPVARVEPQRPVSAPGTPSHRVRLRPMNVRGR